MTHDDIRRMLDAATPGPWEVWRGPEYVGGGEDICIGQGETWLANMDHRCRPHSDPFVLDGWVQVKECDIASITPGEITREQLANAALIAAAPTIIQQLLDENQRLREAMTGWSGYGWYDGIYYDDLQEYFDGILEEKEND